MSQSLNLSSLFYSIATVTKFPRRHLCFIVRDIVPALKFNISLSLQITSLLKLPFLPCLYGGILTTYQPAAGLTEVGGKGLSFTSTSASICIY